VDSLEVNRVLVVTAHPDDVDFGAGGAIAIMTDKGVKVTYCVVSDGDAGGHDRQAVGDELGKRRRIEQWAAARCVGVDDLRFLGYPDGRIEASLDLRRDIVRVIRQVRPELIITHTPERNYQYIPPSHPDHRTVGGATLDAVYPDARNPHTFPELLLEEGLEAWTVREAWLFGGMTPNHHVDITESFDRKLAALRAHESQHAHIKGLEVYVRRLYGRWALDVGLPEGRCAELFQIVPTTV
jgi:LmbE family N-acetylglucosaminyl deacetylase